MGNRSRVISFISSLSAIKDGRKTPTPSTQTLPRSEALRTENVSVNQSSLDISAPSSISAPSTSQHNLQQERVHPNSKPASMLNYTCQPSLMNVDQNTPPELQPIFTLLNDHANKLYQEGYFLKLDDQNTQGKPNSDRIWTECFAQLVGTVLSLWDAAELDLVGKEREVLPKFINLSDASIKMIESLPTRSETDASLQNVLSISTAGKNRYLLHFNSHHSLIQWTAGIRLAMYEHATLQEAYTGALIAGKGKSLNNINAIMERSRSSTADWARVRFGAGTPWRRCWCVVSPADEKEIIKSQKQWKKSPYDRSRPPILKGVIKFYHSKKTKKVKPIATISDAYSAFAIYPQSKPLIDASTLVKVEGSIIIHSNPPSTSEGFVFVMPETHPAVTGFEMMLRWLFPVFDTFGLYGRPGRLVAATEDIRSLLFAMPNRRRYGYLDILDVIGLILEEGSSNWKESQWRKNLKELTAKRMMAIDNDKIDIKNTGRRGTRSSLGPGHFRSVKFDADGDNVSIRSTPSSPWALKSSIDVNYAGYRTRTDSAPPLASSRFPLQINDTHGRSVSESQTLGCSHTSTPLQTSDGTEERSLLPQVCGNSPSPNHNPDLEATHERLSSEDEQIVETTQVNELQDLKIITSPEPVATPPAFVHGPGSLPLSQPFQSSDILRANSRISSSTLNQLTKITNTSFNPENNEERHKNIEKIYEIQDKVSVSYESKDSTYEPGPNDHLITKIRTNEQTTTSTLPRHLNCENKTIAAKGLYSTSSRSVDNLSTCNPPSNFLPLVSTKQSFHDVKRPDSSPSTYTTGCLPSSLLHNQVKDRPLTSIPRDLESNILTLEKLEPDLNLSAGYFINENVFDKISIESSQFRKETDKIELDDGPKFKTNSTELSRSKLSNGNLRNLDKPRAGVLRTVGDIQLDSTEKLLKKSEFDIDFGPTLNYASSRNSGFLNSQLGSSNPKINSNHATNQQEITGRGLLAKGNPDYPESKLGKSEKLFTENRKLAWNPVFLGSKNSNSQRKIITPEDFVAKRTSIASTYAHQRFPSGDALRSVPTTHSVTGKRSNEKLVSALCSRNCSSDNPTTISHSRNSSGELSRYPNSRNAAQALGSHDVLWHSPNDRPSSNNQSPNNSFNLLQRPKSRATSVILSTTSNFNSLINSHLTSREQEHLAKVTGQPLISMATSGKKTPSIGLVAALEAREKDKNVVKQGMNSRAVEQVIQQRQQALSQKYIYNSPTEIRAQYSDSNLLLQTGKGWKVPEQIKTLKFDHSRSLSAFSATEYYPRNR